MLMDIVEDDNDFSSSSESSQTNYDGSDADTDSISYGGGIISEAAAKSLEIINLIASDSEETVFECLESEFNNENNEARSSQESRLNISNASFVSEVNGEEIPSCSSSDPRILSWLSDSSPSEQSTEENYSARQLNAIKRGETTDKIINLCKEKLGAWTPSRREISKFCKFPRVSFKDLLYLLESNNIPEALMLIINMIWSDKTTQNENNVSLSQNDQNCGKLMLLILNCISGTRCSLNTDSVGLEKIMNTDIFTNERIDYFYPISLCLDTSIVTKRTKKLIFNKVEDWINSLINECLSIRKIPLELNFEYILAVATTAVNEAGLDLRPSLIKKYCLEAYSLAREIVYKRCHSFLSTQGFDLLFLNHTPNDIAPKDNSPPIAPNTQEEVQTHQEETMNNQVQAQVPSHHNVSEEEHRGSVINSQNPESTNFAEVLFGEPLLSYSQSSVRSNSIPNSQNSTTRAHEFNNDQRVPLSGSSTTSTSLVRPFDETTVDLGTISWSQSSFGTADSPYSITLSQNSLPRYDLSPPSSQDAPGAAFWNFDQTQSSLFRAQVPSSQESASSQEPDIKRPRF